MIHIYTDGACSGNPGIGGWGAIILENSKEPVYLSGGDTKTTNNRMELTAAISAIKFFKAEQNLEIFTDSKYLKDGVESWIHKWKINGWKTSSKKPVKNKDLWIELENEIKKHAVKWNWVKGHADDKYNEQADLLARKFIQDNI